MTTPEAILSYWLADATESPRQAELREGFWFGADPQVDAEVASRFGEAVAAAAAGRLSGWETGIHSSLALVLLLDQFPRNIHRGTAAAFSHDAAARTVASRGVERGVLSELGCVERAFYLMPFQHSEDLSDQRRSVAFLETLVAEAPAAWRKRAENFLHFGRLHLELIERFGRFPHRNAVLGRTSTDEERTYLEGGGQSFGQTAR